MSFVSTSKVLDIQRCKHTGRMGSINAVRLSVNISPRLPLIHLRFSDWGWGSVQDLRDVVSKYKEADVPLEAIWTDLDVYYRARPLTNDENKFPSAAMHEFVAGLREKGQHYIPLVDSNVYYPDPENTSDVYLPFTRGDTLKTFIRDGSSGEYFIGKAWPGKR